VERREWKEENMCWLEQQLDVVEDRRKRRDEEGEGRLWILTHPPMH
jgi:hypothetical protein